MAPPPKKPRKKTKRQPQPKGRMERSFKNLKQPTLQQWLKVLRTPPVQVQTIFGIDMSVSNPGLCQIQTNTRTIHLYFFRNRQREQSAMVSLNCPTSPLHGWLLEISLIEPNPWPRNASLFRFDSYEGKLRQLWALTGNNSQKNKVIGVEGYSYNAKPTEADTKLKELGGCLRRQLCLNQHELMEIPPSTAKKLFTGDGRATKEKMYQVARTTFGLPDLFALLNISAQPLDHQIMHEGKKVPHPVDDLVDSLAIGISTLFLI
jgi:hypothetical protein